MKNVFKYMLMCVPLAFWLMVSAMAVAAVMFISTSFKHIPDAEQPEPVVVSAVTQPIKTKLTNDLTCLARNIYHESRGEDHSGKVAVGIVTLNRVAVPGFSSTICGVVTQTHVNVNGQSACQFSWRCNPATANAAPAGPAWRESMQVARELMHGDHEQARIDMDNAKYFHSSKYLPSWSRTRVKVVEIGNHIFYR